MNLIIKSFYLLLGYIPLSSATISYYDYNVLHKDDYRFSTGFDSNYILDTYHDIDMCKSNCVKNTDCLGIISFFNQSEVHCNLLNNLGTVDYNKYNSTSYKKIIRFKDNNKYNIYGNIKTAGDTYDDVELDVYIDSNHNGIWDIDEPITRTIKGNFNFLNMSRGKYLIREKLTNECRQIIPGNIGIPNSYTGNGYPDRIFKLYIDHHELKGGIINETNVEIKQNFILGNQNDKYLTFYPNDELIVIFTDESIVNYDGYDINFKLLKNTLSYVQDTKAHISVSTTGLNFTYLGILDENNTRFDLGTINYTEHVSYVRMHFFGGNNGINLSNIYGSSNSLYSPSYAHYVSVPLMNNLEIDFINDCHFHYPCYFHCFLVD